MSVALMGFTHVGKSLFGRLAAKELGVSFVDTDRLIEAHLKMPLRLYYKMHGEKAFRDLEGVVCTKLAQNKDKKIIALGGGSPLELFVGNTKLIYLRATKETLLSRITTFPPFAPNKEALLALMQRRFCNYSAHANFVIDVEVQGVTKRICELFRGK